MKHSTIMYDPILGAKQVTVNVNELNEEENRARAIEKAAKTKFTVATNARRNYNGRRK